MESTGEEVAHTLPCEIYIKEEPVETDSYQPPLEEFEQIYVKQENIVSTDPYQQPLEETEPIDIKEGSVKVEIHEEVDAYDPLQLNEEELKNEVGSRSDGSEQNRLLTTMSSKRKHSSVWTHFTESENRDSKKAKCNHCSKIISFAGGSHGNLARHMKAKHALIPITMERRPQIMSNFSSFQSNQTTSVSKNVILVTYSQQSMNQYVRTPLAARKVEEIDRQVVKMVAKGYHGLRIVEEKEFRKLMELVSSCPGYKLPSRKTLSESLISKVHNDIKDEVQRKVQAVSALSLSADSWTSRNNDSYVAIIAHFIDEETKLQSALLGCINYNDRHTSQNLCNFMKDVMADWHLSDKVAAIVSNDAAHILSAVRLGDWRSISCFAHSLNLVVQEATKEMSDILAQVKNIIEFFNRSTQGQKKLIATQQQMNLPVLKLKQDVQTRWNSTFDMLQRVVQIKDAVISTLALLRSDLIIKESDWEIIEGILPLLRPFYEITVEISAEKNVPLSKVIVFCNLLKCFLQKHASNNEKIVAVLSVLKKGMEDHFKDIENDVIYAECTILDPRFRQKGFRNKRAYEVAIQRLRNKIGKVQLPQRENREIPMTRPTPSDSSSSGNNSSSSQENRKDSIWDEYDQEIRNITTPDNQLAAGIRELDKYLNEEYLDRKKDPLEWWHQRRQLYPHVYAYVLKRFCIVATSVPCERIFSSTGQILNERRKLLSTNEVSKLIFLHNNM